MKPAVGRTYRLPGSGHWNIFKYVEGVLQLPPMGLVACGKVCIVLAVEALRPPTSAEEYCVFLIFENSLMGWILCNNSNDSNDDWWNEL